MKRDKLIFNLLEEELQRQEEGLELIASENFVSKQVLEAAGSVATNKYAEGLPGKRYYGGCEIVDQIETIAIERAKQLFNAAWANVPVPSTRISLPDYLFPKRQAPHGRQLDPTRNRAAF